VPANLIILFAKAPVAHAVKTRLAPIITPEFAAGLHLAFVTDMIARFHTYPGADFELHTDKRTDEWPTPVVTRKLQISGDLGLKMIHSLEHGLQAGYQRVAIVGSDAPTLPTDHIRQLLEMDADVAFGPADDGGYYAVASRKIHPAMFDGVVWSRSDTLAKSIEAVKQCGLSVAVGPQWFDVDTPADFQRLLRVPDLPPCTAAYLANFTRAPTDTCGCAESAD
jgi:rSAM/selenodomain-associated transferase 1